MTLSDDVYLCNNCNEWKCEPMDGKHEDPENKGEEVCGTCYNKLVACDSQLDTMTHLNLLKIED